jgi:D-lactate dehydrogenase
MRIAVFSTKAYDIDFLDLAAQRSGHELQYFEARLTADTAPLAAGFPVACVFVNDQLDRAALQVLAAGGTRLIALRCAGFNNIDLHAAQELGIAVTRVPAYSPYAVAEFTVGLILSLNRRIHRAYARTRDNNFSLDGLIGFDMHGRTAGVIGTGAIGTIVARILRLGFGCEVLAADLAPKPELTAIGVRYMAPRALALESDIITLHCPLTPQTHRIVNRETMRVAKRGFMLVNTSRGALVDAEALIEGLKSGQVGSAALDVYEQEADVFFEDLSDEIIHDDVLQRLLSFPNVLLTGHQAFFTREALSNIAQTTLDSATAFARREVLQNRIGAERVKESGSSRVGISRVVLPKAPSTHPVNDV